MSLGRVLPNDPIDEDVGIGIGYGADVVPCTDDTTYCACEDCGKELNDKNSWYVTPICDHYDRLVLCSECACQKDRI